LVKPDVAFETTYQKEVLNQLDGAENDDIFSLSFIAWLVVRWEKKPAYEFVLKIIQDKNTVRLSCYTEDPEVLPNPLFN
jgi:hypothetical protein